MSVGRAGFVLEVAHRSYRRSYAAGVRIFALDHQLQYVGSRRECNVYGHYRQRVFMGGHDQWVIYHRDKRDHTSGTGSVSFSVAENPGDTRTGTLTIAGQNVVINQAPNDPLFGSWGGTISKGSGCPANLPPSVEWTGIIRRTSAATTELVISIPLVAVFDQVIPITFTGNSLQFFVVVDTLYTFNATLAADRRSMSGTFSGGTCSGFCTEAPITTRFQGVPWFQGFQMVWFDRFQGSKGFKRWHSERPLEARDGWYTWNPTVERGTSGTVGTFADMLSNSGRSGGTGRRAGLKIPFSLRECGFDPLLRHHVFLSKSADFVALAERDQLPRAVDCP